MTAVSIPPVPETDSSRYQLRHALGQGGAGAVFLARDHETGEEVALKKLFNLDQRSVQRFKREFRALADLHHPNVVKLYDLQRASDAWFLTMEFIDGVDLQRELIPVDSLATYNDIRATPRDSEPDPERIQRIAGVFHQLALGILAMHEAGMLHRDLKPSNVVVAKTGRVVLVDFGLVRELSNPLKLVTLDNAPAGTPAYMPPEQALGLQLTEASDWYAFGVMLYEVLSGVLPIDARNPIQLIQRKLSRDPAKLPRGVAPKALGELCMRLLSREAAARPRADEILRVLTTLDRETILPEMRNVEHTFTGQREAPARAMLIGREAELSRLHDALARARENQSVVMHVRGTSGAGKSTLVESFFDELQIAPHGDGPEPVVLRGRCYEREAIPFKALDGVADALVAHLSTLDDLQLAHVLPGEVHALTQLFPIFERLHGVQRLLAADHRPLGTAAQTRRNAERALRELFTKVARLRPLVMWIDDLQWGDLDSANLIRDWLTRPAEAPLLLVLSYRSEEMATSACLRTVLDSPVSLPAVATQYELDLQPMRDTDVEALCNRRLGPSVAPPPALVSRIVSESQGNPFLASQLTALAHAKLQRGEMDLEDVTVEELVLRTSALLPEAARGLLSVLAIAGRPLVPHLALAAADVERDGRSQIHALQGLRLVRMRDVDTVRLLEVYHDRVREAVQSSLTEGQRRQIHERLLRVLETSGQSDPAWLHELARGAGQGVLALRYGVLAAEIASSSLAFERAAELYAQCLPLTDAREQLASLWFKLGLALARCRRGAQAAEAYLKASEYANEQRRIPLLQHAASHLLRSGRYEEGEQLVQRGLRALNVELPSTRAGYYAAIAWEYARFTLFSRSVKPRPPSAVQPEEAQRSEYYAMLAIETQAYAPLRAALFQMRSLRLAYQCGEPMTMARALCMSATIACLSGTKAAARRSTAQLELAERFVEADDTPDVRVELLSARAICALFAGRVTDVLAPAYAADEIYETRSSGGEAGDYYYMFAVYTVRIGALQHMGRHTQANAELRALLAHAVATDNRTAMLQASFGTTLMEQVTERCASSRQRLDRERAELPRGEVGILHVLHMAAAMRAAAMTGDFDWALGIVDLFWKGYLDSTIRHSAQLAFLLRSNRSCLLLNRYVASGRQGDPEQVIAEDLRWLSNKAPEPFRAPARSRLRARLACLRNDLPAAAALFRDSMRQHAELGAEDEAARERFALGCVVGGEEGARLKTEALNALRALGVVDPDADVRGYYPELTA